MADYLVVIVDRTSARFLTLEPVEFPEYESGPKLVPCHELANPEFLLDARDLYADSKTGRGAAPGGGPVHGFDDKRNQHAVHLTRKFAAQVMTHIIRISNREKIRNIVLIASARMRSLLFPEAERLVRQGYRVIKLSKNMTNFSPQKIHQYLAQAGLIPSQRYVNA